MPARSRSFIVFISSIGVGLLVNLAIVVIRGVFFAKYFMNDPTPPPEVYQVYTSLSYIEPFLGYAIILIGFIYLVMDLVRSATRRIITFDTIDSQRNVGPLIQKLSESEPGNVQKIAASQIELLNGYYNTVLAQAATSFRWAIIFAGIGSSFFLGSIAYLLYSGTNSDVTTAGIISGSIIQVISGINFYLYGKTAHQLADFHLRLDQTQRFLLANSLIESLNGGPQDSRRSWLIEVIATVNSGAGAFTPSKSLVGKGIPSNNSGTMTSGGMASSETSRVADTVLADTTRGADGNAK